MPAIGKYLIFTGIILVIAGLIFWFFGDRLGWLGNLPGDLKIRKEKYSFYFPITTMILVSITISFILWIIRKFF